MTRVVRVSKTAPSNSNLGNVFAFVKVKQLSERSENGKARRVPHFLMAFFLIYLGPQNDAHEKDRRRLSVLRDRVASCGARSISGEHFKTRRRRSGALIRCLPASRVCDRMVASQTVLLQRNIVSLGKRLTTRSSTYPPHRK